MFVPEPTTALEIMKFLVPGPGMDKITIKVMFLFGARANVII